MRLRILTLNVWNEEGDPRRVELLNLEHRCLSYRIEITAGFQHEDLDPGHRQRVRDLTADAPEPTMMAS
jgi:hypothetical protein